MRVASGGVDDIVASTPPPSEPPEPTGSRLDDWAARFFTTPARRRLWTWGAPIAVTILAAVLRLWDLGHPHALVFDETYYVKDSYTLMHLGYEASWPDNADASFNAGDTDIYTSAPEFVAHPPFGKWLISLGLAVFGAQDSVGWRISTAIVGILAVILVMLIAKKMFRSTFVATVAGFLMALDGHAIVMSRVALLDNSVMFFALLGVGAILLDRDWLHRRMADWFVRKRAAGLDPSWGPTLWWRPWLLVAAVLFGLTSGVKWSGIYFLAVFACYTVVVDGLARRRNGLPFWISASILKQGPATFLIMIPLATATYVATWTGWLVTSGGYFRTWVQTGGQAWTGALAWVPNWAQNLWHYQAEMYQYHITLHTPHPYQSNPLTWLFMIRPTSMYYAGSSYGQNGCSASACSEAITGIGNPLIWWAAAAACFYLVYRLVRYREWQVGLILTGMVAGYLPWFLYLGRTVFEFYVIAFEPYMLMALAYTIGLVVGKPSDVWWKRQRGIRLVAVYGIFVVLVSAFFYPLWTGEQIPFWYWQSHIWLPSWR